MKPTRAAALYRLAGRGDRGEQVAAETALLATYGEYAMSFLDLPILVTALGLDEDADAAAVLDKISALRDAAGESDDDDDDASGILTLIKAGKHEQVSLNDDGTVTLTLNFPITHGKDAITELVLHRPRAADLMKMDDVKGEHRKSIALLASMASRTMKELLALDMSDIEVGSAVIGFFRAKSRKTGPS